MIKYFISTGLLFFVLNAFSTVNATVFPNEVEDCITSTVCSSPVLVEQTSSFSAYSYTDSGTDKFLFEYTLGTLSNESTNFTTTSLSGDAWLSANATYDLNLDQHFFTLYLDGVTPSPTNLWLGDSDGLDIELSMPTSDLLSGSSYFQMLFVDFTTITTEGNLVTHGDGAVFDGQSLFICLDISCEVGAELNLLFMLFIQTGDSAQLVLNPDDPRGTFYSQYRDYDFDDTWYTSQTYSVIPIPPAAWLFGSGLLGLIVTTSRRGK